MAGHHERLHERAQEVYAGGGQAAEGGRQEIYNLVLQQYDPGLKEELKTLVKWEKMEERPRLRGSLDPDPQFNAQAKTKEVWHNDNR